MKQSHSNAKKSPEAKVTFRQSLDLGGGDDTPLILAITQRETYGGQRG